MIGPNVWLRLTKPTSRTNIVISVNFGVCFVAVCDTRLGVGFYAVGSVSRRASPTLKISSILYAWAGS